MKQGGIKTMAPVAKILFITWDGGEVRYIENLFAPIFKQLQETYNYEFHIAQFTWANKKTIISRDQYLKNLGIHYLPISLNSNYMVTNILKAKYLSVGKLKKYIEYHSIGILMPRAVTSYFIIQGLINRGIYRLIYDADGFPLEERVEFNGLSKTSYRYKFFKKVEKKGYNLANAIICRSSKAKAIIINHVGSDRDKIFCVNNGTLIPRKNNTFPERSSCHFIYAGSIGPQYMIKEMINMFLIVYSKIDYAKLTILTMQGEKARNLVHELALDSEELITIKSVPPELIYEELQKADIGISFRKRSYSMQGVAPIKVCEYLGAGLSVIFSPGVGDLDDTLRDKDFTYSYDPLSFKIDDLTNWIIRQDNTSTRDKVLDFAHQVFPLDNTVSIYHQALQYSE